MYAVREKFRSGQQVQHRSAPQSGGQKFRQGASERQKKAYHDGDEMRRIIRRKKKRLQTEKERERERGRKNEGRREEVT